MQATRSAGATLTATANRSVRQVGIRQALAFVSSDLENDPEDFTDVIPENGIAPPGNVAPNVSDYAPVGGDTKEARLDPELAT